MKIGEEEVWVTGGLGLTTADLPQGNDLAGILRQNANYGCRTCEVFKENLTEIDYDIKKHGRYHHLTDNYFDYLHQLHDIPSLQTAFAKEHGLCIKPNVLDQLFRDRHTQTPQDAFHAVAGLGGRLLNITLESFTRDGEAKFLTFAICSKAVFAELMADNDYVRLDATLQYLSIDLLKVFPEEFSNLPNLHVLRHLSEHARRFGNLINASVSLKEMVHRIYKSYVPHTNKKNVELDFIKRENTLQSLRYLIDRGLHNHIQINGKIKSLFDGWYLTSQVYSNEDIEEDQENNFTSPSSNYINIKVRSKWNKQKIQENGFSGRKLDENMVSDISWTYDNYFGQQAAVAHYNINFYQHLSFTIIDDDMIIEENIKLQAGDVVEIEGKEDNDDIENEKWFARIQAIFVH
ncbi:uncharacterized protein OCT59_002445 [Rhizophagus irregularis]|uniref:uncharacterized protein n=1 Tax=Rhizophagus irregularis TaxID=588596 RepID=UPI003331D142|nr:hypothetical protein OCT59_002445 [Rhizophagus irregularis]